MAPELLLGNSVPSEQSDVWSVGIIFHEMLFMKVPFLETDAFKLQEMFRETEYSIPANDLHLGKHTQKFLLQMLDRSPYFRIRS